MRTGLVVGVRPVRLGALTVSCARARLAGVGPKGLRESLNQKVKGSGAELL